MPETFFKVGLPKFAQLVEFFLLRRLQLEHVVTKLDAADLDTRDFLLGSNRPNDFLKEELSVFDYLTNSIKISKTPKDWFISPTYVPYKPGCYFMWMSIAAGAKTSMCPNHSKSVFFPALSR